MLAFWLEPVGLAGSTRFRAGELRELERYVRENRDQFREAWREYFGS